MNAKNIISLLTYLIYLMKQLTIFKSCFILHKSIDNSDIPSSFSETKKVPARPIKHYISSFSDFPVQVYPTSRYDPCFTSRVQISQYKFIEL